MAEQGIMYFVPVAGPAMEALKLAPKQGGIVLGRGSQCDLAVPQEGSENVSRTHVRLDFVSGRWRISDLNSRWGTFLNGVRMTAGRETPLREGDLIRIAPWTFSFSSVARRPGSETRDDLGQATVRTFMADSHPPMREDTLTLLLESAAAIHGAASEQGLAELVMEAALRGTGLANAVMLRPIDASGDIDVIASKTLRGLTTEKPSFSRSLINAASQGNVAEISGPAAGTASQSIMELNVSSAICVPLMLGATPAALLYLDSRGRAGALRQGSAAFCVALGRMASLALGNLKRVDIERRQASMEAELTAAAEAQKWILPPREIKIGNVHIIGESRAGHFVGGDFFDIIQLADDRVAVALGDVSGHGVAASVLMTATQSFLHATLLANPDPGWAAIMANRFIHPRREGNRFVTMWLGIFDPRAGKLTYVDAGHGYGLMSHADGTLTTLNAERGLPLGVVDDSEYVVATTELKPESCVLVVSDGIIEQPRKAIDGAEREKRVQFDLGGVKDVLSTAGDGCDVISALFDAVVRHAGTTELSDDATAVMVRWKC